MTERSTWIHTSTMIATPSLVCVDWLFSASNFLKAIATPIVEVITPRTWPCKKIKKRTTTMWGNQSNKHMFPKLHKQTTNPIKTTNARRGTIESPSVVLWRGISDRNPTFSECCFVWLEIFLPGVQCAFQTTIWVCTGHSAITRFQLGRKRQMPSTRASHELCTSQWMSDCLHWDQ